MKKIFIILGLVAVCWSSLNARYHQEDIFDHQTGYKKYKVVSSTPITQEITKKVYVGNDINDRVIHKRVPCNRSSSIDHNSIGIDTLIGAVAGVAIGNQFRKHKDAAKVIGGIGGGYIANQLRSHSSNECYEQVTTQEYTPRYETKTENIVVAYDNCIFIDGEKICKRTKHKKKFLKVKRTYSVY